MLTYDELMFKAADHVMKKFKVIASPVMYNQTSDAFVSIPDTSERLFQVCKLFRSVADILMAKSCNLQLIKIYQLRQIISTMELLYSLENKRSSDYGDRILYLNLLEHLNRLLLNK